MKQKITWLLFHEPAELFIRTAEHFEQEVNRLSNDQFEFEILELSDYEARYHNGKSCDPVEELRAGRVHMSQCHTSLLAYANATNILALGLPFIFRDHDHATRVFEGQIGEELLDHVKQTMGIQGLSFTYSGGYKVMASNSPVTSVDDFAHLKFKQDRMALTQDMFAALGATAVADGTHDFRDTTLPRFGADAREDQRWATQTGHAMYLTTILMNDAMWEEFDEQTQLWFKQAARECAKTERAQSVADGEFIASNREKQQELGIDQVLSLPETEIDRLKALLAPVTEKWRAYFPNNLVDRIEAA